MGVSINDDVEYYCINDLKMELVTVKIYERNGYYIQLFLRPGIGTSLTIPGL
jgi:hypothetical protein